MSKPPIQMQGLNLAREIAVAQAKVVEAQAQVALAASLAAQAAASAQEAEDLIVSDLGTTDGQTRALIEAPGSQTAQALSASTAALAPARARDFHANRPPYPVFTKPLTAPVATAASTFNGSIYWPWVMRVDGLIANPLDTYYMWYSTDHAESPGGIGLKTAHAPTGPWTDRGQVYVDTVTGDQTETPSVIWNEATSEFYLYYQQRQFPSAGRQSTLMARSADGRTGWTRVGPVLVAPNQTEVFGSGNVTYFRPFKIGERWYGYHVYGDGDFFRMGISYSNDGITWEISRNQLGTGIEWDPVGRREIGWNQLTIFQWDGRPWGIFMLTQRVSGTTVGDNRIAIAPMSTDLRRITAAPKVILPVSQAWETTNLRGLYAFTEGAQLHVYYQTDGNVGYAKGA